MAESYFGQIPLGDIRVDEDMWGAGATGPIQTFLTEVYDPEQMPPLQVSKIAGREGYWLLGWDAGGTEWPSLLELIFGEEYAVHRHEQVLSDRILKETVLCPRCRFNRYTPYGGDVDRRMVEKYPFPALSRTDNETHICAECGFAEATVGVTPQSEWPTFIPGSFGQGRTL